MIDSHNPSASRTVPEFAQQKVFSDWLVINIASQSSEDRRAVKEFLSSGSTRDRSGAETCTPAESLAAQWMLGNVGDDNNEVERNYF